MSLANLKATTEYQEAIQATEDIESPAVGFAKTFDYKGDSSKVYTIIEKGIQPADLEDSISSLAKRLDNFSISGIFMIRFHALHRRSAGTNALVVLKDTRWEDSQKIIGTIEVDLSAGTQLVYMFPDMVLSIDDFHNHVEVAIQTHRYDSWQGGESNLLVTIAMIGRLSNTSYMGFQYSVDNVVDHLTTTGITAIPGERKSVEELEGMSWNLKPSEQTTVCVPSRVAVNERHNRSLSLQFERYRRAPQLARYLVDQHDQEILANDHLDEDEEHFIGICFQDPQTQHIPYDICFCEDCLNEDDQLAIQKHKSEMEWENSFAAQRAQIINKHEEHAFPTVVADVESSTSYQPPPSLSKKIEESFKAKHPALAKELRDLSLCSDIPIPGYYKNNRKKYEIRKSRTYKGKPHNSHVKPFKRKYKDDSGRVKKCKCFIFGKEGHFANDCRSKQGNITRSTVYQELDHDDNWDIVSTDFDDSSVYSISKGESDVYQNISTMVQDTPLEEAAFMAIEGTN
ncbi:Orf y [Tanacetum coccineum]|uniref:TPA: Orf y n=1 Tax=Tanacetum coccineum TaxID=301880 RepID=A0ABQ5BW14_9ASTR